MSQPLFFKIYKNNKLKGVKQFSLEQVSIGSSPDVDIVLEEASPWHTLIEKRGESYVISDLGGDGGTLLNGKKAVEDELSSGDRIQIGDFLIEFFIGAPFVKNASAAKKTAPPPEEPVEAPQPKASKKTEKEPAKTTAKKSAPVKRKPVKKSVAKPSSEENSKVKTPVEKVSSHIQEEEEIDFENTPSKVSEAEEAGTNKIEQPQFVQKTSASGAVDEGADIVRKSFRSNPWKNFVPSKPSKKTFAPPSFVKDLDKAIPPGKGGVVEVLVAWGDRIVSVYHSKKNETITIGNHPKASIKIPNLVSKEPYPLVHAGQIAQVNLMSTMSGKIIRENKSIDFETALAKGVMTQAGAERKLSLGQNELIRVDFHSNLKVYVRYTSLSSKASKATLFDFNETELVGLGLAFCFMLALFFFVGIYYPRYLVDEEKLEEKTIRIAKIQFKPPVRKMLKKAAKKKQVRKKVNIPIASKKKVRSKKPPSIKKKGKAGKIGAVAAKPQKKKKVRKKTVTSARPGGNRIKSKKDGAGARSPKPDPTKIGLLGTFGKKGIQQQLDKVYSGAGELGGLADKATGRSGSQEVYSGEGIGTKFKDPGAGGKGSNLIGIAGISTKGRGGGVKGFGRGGGLGTRGSVNLSFGSSEIDVEGSIDKEAIRRVVRNNQSQLERCHSMVLQNNPSIQGRIRVQWTIEDSRVTGVVIKSNDSGSRKLANCLASRLKNWRFVGAVPKGGVGNVTFPFVFTGG